MMTMSIPILKGLNITHMGIASIQIRIDWWPQWIGKILILTGIVHVLF